MYVQQAHGHGSQTFTSINYFAMQHGVLGIGGKETGVQLNTEHGTLNGNELTLKAMRRINATILSLSLSSPSSSSPSSSSSQSVLTGGLGVAFPPVPAPAAPAGTLLVCSCPRPCAFSCPLSTPSPAEAVPCHSKAIGDSGKDLQHVCKSAIATTRECRGGIFSRHGAAELQLKFSMLHTWK